MHEGSKPSSYVRMVANDYYDDFESEFEQCADFLKLERAQVLRSLGMVVGKRLRVASGMPHFVCWTTACETCARITRRCVPGELQHVESE